MRPLCIGLTGGIGSGKSAVSALFERLGVPVIDTDLIAREVVAPGTPALQEIVEAFGTDLVNERGELKRDRLRSMVFRDTQRRKRLEEITHPRIQQAVAKRVAAVESAYCIVVIPLLVETSGMKRFDRVLVVDAPAEQQVERVMLRDHLTADDVEAIMRTQATREARLAAADDIIVNGGELTDLKPQVEALHKKYLEICSHSQSQ